MAGGYGHQPKGNQKLAAELRELKEQIAQLRAQIAGLGIQIDPATSSLVIGAGQGRALRIVSASGANVAIIGTQPGLAFADGTPQAGVAFYREDGSVAAFLGDANPLVAPFKQSWQIYDRAGNVVMADDTNGGVGLAKPWMGSGCHLADTNTSRWPQTTSASFVDIATGWYTVQNPRLSWDISLVADTATAGQARLLVGGTQVSTTQTVGTSFSDWFASQVALPAGVAVGSIAFVQLQARRTSGTGSVYGIAQRFAGDQSP